jgi:hypothetical protein
MTGAILIMLSMPLDSFFERSILWHLVFEMPFFVYCHDN